MSKMLCQDESVDIGKCLAGLYYDLGGTSMPKQYGNLCRITSKEYILYGSDVPFMPLPICCKLAETMDSGLTGEMQELVYRRNPEVLLRRKGNSRSICINKTGYTRTCKMSPGAARFLRLCICLISLLV